MWCNFSFLLRYSAAEFCYFGKKLLWSLWLSANQSLTLTQDEKVISGSNATPPICQIRISRQQSYFCNQCSRSSAANGVCQIRWWNIQAQNVGKANEFRSGLDTCKLRGDRSRLNLSYKWLVLNFKMWQVSLSYHLMWKH